MPRFEAPSISRTSMDSPSVISLQLEHTLQGVSVGPVSQFRAFAKIRATDVFPIPLGPLKTKAWAIRLWRMAFCRVLTTWSCPITSPKS